MSLLKQWFFPSNLFGLRGTVDSIEYATVGFTLCLLKYLVEFAVIFWVSGLFLTPIDFVSPFLSSKQYYLSASPEWLGMAWLLWTLPFLWVGVCMSIRRSMNAGASPWIGMIILVPFANIFGMILLAVSPSRVQSAKDAEQEAANSQEVAAIYRPPMFTPTEGKDFYQAAPNLTSALIGIGSGAAYLLLSVLFSVYILGSYGAAMFFGAPIFTCAVSAYFLNQRKDYGFGTTTIHSILTLLFASMAFLLFGIEGGICIVMAIPIFAPLGLLGGFIGYSIAVSTHRPERDERNGLYGCLVILPVIAWVESVVDQSPTIEVRSSIVISAPAEVVWNQVIDFPEITAEPVGILRTGVAYPIRAHIRGSGVGAIRYCEFTTGSFVEPITVWDEPRRLEFDVTEQPEPMAELSPYRHIHPPHLDGSFRSVRGEFRLVAIDSKTTRLEGSTWYKLDIKPRIYWKLWTDWILHRIHHRVLVHIRELSEHD